MESLPQQEHPILNIIGEKVALGALRRDLIRFYLKWINDVVVTRTNGLELRPLTLEAVEAWYERVSRGGSDVYFTIYERQTLRPIGTTHLDHVDRYHGTAEFNILIGETDCWGRGYGTETTRLMLDWGFFGMGLHCIMLRVSSDNERGIRAYTRAGFREVGRQREALRRGGQRDDIIYMDCLATEFQSPVLGRLLDLVDPPS
jgi:diamine N-acetyltransferase